MKNKVFAFTLIRAVALWLFVQFVLIHLFNLIPVFIRDLQLPADIRTPLFSYIYALVNAGIYLLISILLWIWADGLSNKLIITNAGEGKIEKVDMDKVYPAAITIMGFYFILSSIPPILNNLLMGYFSGAMGEKFTTENTIILVRLLVTLFIGLICVMKTGWLIGLVNKLRKLGVEKN